MEAAPRERPLNSRARRLPVAVTRKILNWTRPLPALLPRTVQSRVECNGKRAIIHCRASRRDPSAPSEIMMGVKCLGTSVIVLVTGLTSRESVTCWRLVHGRARAGERGRRERIYLLPFEFCLFCASSIEGIYTTHVYTTHVPRARPHRKARHST